jgi:DNA-binding MarR family transcriptional regulator
MAGFRRNAHFTPIDIVQGGRPEDQSLGMLIHLAQSMLQPAASEALRPLSLTLSEFIFLRMLLEWPGASNADIAREANVSPQAIHKVLRGLEDTGAVERPVSAPSGRALPARLTRNGRSLLTRAIVAVQVAEDEVLSGLTQAERRQLKRLLGAVWLGSGTKSPGRVSR